jgi:hypothetical protein
MVPSQSTLHDSGNDKKSPAEIMPSGNDKKSPAKTVPLPLAPLDCKAPHCDECIEFTLKSDPTNSNSSEYKFQMCYLKGTEDVYSILARKEDDVNCAIARLGIVNPTPMYVLYTQCLC